MILWFLKNLVSSDSTFEYCSILSYGKLTSVWFKSRLISMKLRSFRQFLCPFTLSCLFSIHHFCENGTVRFFLLPFKSKVIVWLNLSWTWTVFYIMITLTGANAYVLIVNAPYILAKRLLLFVVSKWQIRSSSMLRRTCISVPLKVLMIYLSSLEKKKNEPLFPVPSPDLKMLWMLDLMSRDWIISNGDNPSSSMIL